MYITNIAEADKAPGSAPPLSTDHTVENAKHFLLKDDVDIRDIMLHAMLLICMNTGMRYDEATKFKNGSSQIH